MNSHYYRPAWGDECTVAQVIKQANDNALNAIRKAFVGAKGVKILDTNVKVVSSKEGRR